MAAAAATDHAATVMGSLAHGGVRALRQAVAAVGLPDEGMRGSSADALKLQAASEPSVALALARALRGNDLVEADAAGAALRSIAVTPAAAGAMSTLAAGAVPGALAEALRRSEGTSFEWALRATLRLAQHRETHARLLAAGVVEPLEIRLSAGPSPGGSRQDLGAAITLAFLTETETSLADRVPSQLLPELVQMLQWRLDHEDPAEVVAKCVFCGMPLFYRPRLLVQACANLAAEGSGRAHAEALWNTELPRLLVGLLDGHLPNDTASNKPYGSPDAVEMAHPCAQALLTVADRGDSQERAALEHALRRFAAAPADGRP